MHWHDLLMQYGYYAVFLGCLAEGETLLVLAGFAAHRGYLSLTVVVLIAFVAGALGDQVLYFVGRHFGPRLFARFPKLHPQFLIFATKLRRHEIPVIVGVRFMYGFRIIGPLVIGASHVSPQRFVPFNLLGALMWALIIASAGYVFGETLRLVLRDLGDYELAVVLAVVAVAALLGLVRHVRRRERDRQLREAGEV